MWSSDERHPGISPQATVLNESVLPIRMLVVKGTWVVVVTNGWDYWIVEDQSEGAR